jgi:hypothetical protein
VGARATILQNVDLTIEYPFHETVAVNDDEFLPSAFPRGYEK